MNRLDVGKRAMILRCLTEGTGIRSAGRLTGASKNTITKLVVEFGEFAGKYQSEKLVKLPCKDIQIDETWSFVGCREKTKAKIATKHHGDVWTWVAICRDTKLVPSWLIADRGHLAARQLIEDLAPRLANRIQLTTDGHRAYIYAIKGVFGEEVDFGRLVKVYSSTSYGRETVVSAEKEPVIGYPDESRICTSHVERANLTMRMNMRRFTRLTNGFSKKVENHAAMVAIHFLNCNMIRTHQTIKTAPAVAAGVLDRPMKLEEALEEFDVFRRTHHPVNRPTNYRKKRDTPRTYEPAGAPLTPWYLDPESGGPNPPLHELKSGVSYQDSN